MLFAMHIHFKQLSYRPFLYVLLCIIHNQMEMNNMCYAQECPHRGQKSDYDNKESVLYKKAIDSMHSGHSTIDNRGNRIVIATDVYSFAQNQTKSAIFDSLLVKSRARDFSACFISDGASLYMFVFEEFYKEPLTRMDVSDFTDRSLFGVMVSNGCSIYLYGECPSLITRTGKKHTKEYVAGKGLFNLSYPPPGCFVVQIFEDCISFIDFIPDE